MSEQVNFLRLPTRANMVGSVIPTEVCESHMNRSRRANWRDFEKIARMVVVHRPRFRSQNLTDNPLENLADSRPCLQMSFQFVK